MASATAFPDLYTTREINPNKHTLFAADETGDTPIQWDKDNPEEVAKAKERFDELVAKGYRAYTVNTRGERTHQLLSTFDPAEERIMMMPRVIGG